MEPSVKTSREPAHGGCEFLPRIDAYHDGELDSASAAEVEQHLTLCAICQSELRELRELSSLAKNIGSSGVSPVGMARIHRAIDDEQESAPSVLRIAGMLTGLAASILIIGSAWLWETPPAHANGRDIIVISSPEQPAMNLAMNLEPALPLPRSPWEVQDQQMIADARLADWMVEGLSGR